jgi:oxygen-independent coproporphyrinogen-3 oxidase
MQQSPLGLYVHLPWCVRKCPYCDFNSHQVRDGVPSAEYSEALISDLERDLPLVWGRPVSSIYFGGGTPSLFSAQEIGSLISAFRARLVVVPDAEITLEANPGTIERDSFEAYREAGVNRVSLGVQSFEPEILKRIGRIHGPDEVATSLDSLRRAGMDNFNIDLMFGQPGQSQEQAISDISRAIDAGATHISHYQLTIEPNTAFAARPPELPGEDASWEMQEATAELLSANGFEQYEISAWSKPGRKSEHNLNYWRYGDFLGIGAGAHAKISNIAENKIQRLSRHRHPRQYMDGQHVAEDRVIEGSERMFEYFLNRLRLLEGIGPSDFTARTGLAWEHAEPGLSEASKKGLLERRGDQYFHTETGWRFVNDIQALFLT